MTIKHWVWVLIVLVGATACDSRMRRRDDAPMAALDADLRAKEGEPEPRRKPPGGLPPEVMQALIPSAPGAMQGQRAAKPAKPARMDVNVYGVSAKEFFMGLVDGTPYNMVVHPDVEGQIALQLKNVTVEEVMEAVRQLYGYEYKFLPNGYQVLPAPKGLQTRIFKLDFLNMARHGRSGIRVGSGDLTQMTGGTGSGSQGQSGTSGQGGSSGQGSGQQTRINNDIITNTESDFWQELEDTLGMIINCPSRTRQPYNQQQGSGTGQMSGQLGGQSGSSGNNQITSACTVGRGTAGNVAAQAATAVMGSEQGGGANPPQLTLDHKILGINRDTGVVIVRALPEELRAIEDFIRMTKNSVARQVILDAKIMEVELGDDFQSGINWSVLSKKRGQDLVSLQQTGGKADAADQFGTNNIAAVTEALAAASPYGGMFTLALHARDIDALITLLETQGNVQVLSSPRIATLNNQKAIIKVGSDEFFVTNVESNTQASGGTGTLTSNNITLTPFFSGIALDVTPQIGDAGDVTLHIHPSISDVKDGSKSFTVNGQEQSLPLALSSNRESDSIVRARDGQLVVIGGMMKNESTERTAANPLLSQLPLLGPLFRHSWQQSRKTELVILLRPTVVDPDKTWGDETRKVGDRMRGYQDEMNQRYDEQGYTFGQMH
ncbi:MAG: pilus (MSHA type) biogenesis protein MshL [Methylococcaceae bacterium]|nr:MAG: pilus (MSHA type) biogenesis protein MshL [Methylococcaceae bacterium]